MSVAHVHYLQSIQFVMEGLTSVSPPHNTVTFLLLCTTPAFSAAEHVWCFPASIPTKIPAKQFLVSPLLIQWTALFLHCQPSHVLLAWNHHGSSLTKPPQFQLSFHSLPLDMGILSRNISQINPLLNRNYSKAYSNHKGLQQPIYQIC